MPTNEERQEVARKLREVKKTGFDFTWCKVCITVCGPDCPVGCDEDEMAVNAAQRIADLIEPEPERTCYNEGLKGFVCSECGYVGDSKAPNYCENCGAKVVEGDDE